MPELPEVETVMRGLQLRLEGRRIAAARVNRPDLRWALPPGLAARLTGARVESFRRRAKYILMRLDGGDSVLVHLGMSGRMVIGPLRPNAPVLHEHVVLETDDGARRLGEVALVPYSSPISRSGRLFYSTLFDENAASHIALGQSYSKCIRGGGAMDDLHHVRVGLLGGDVEGAEARELGRDLSAAFPGAVGISMKVVAGADGGVHRRGVEAGDGALRGDGRGGSEDPGERECP